MTMPQEIAGLPVYYGSNHELDPIRDAGNIFRPAPGLHLVQSDIGSADGKKHTRVGLLYDALTMEDQVVCEHGHRAQPRYGYRNVTVASRPGRAGFEASIIETFTYLARWAPLVLAAYKASGGADTTTTEQLVQARQDVERLTAEMAPELDRAPLGVARTLLRLRGQWSLPWDRPQERLTEWAQDRDEVDARRDPLIAAVIRDGAVTKKEAHQMTGVARTTIDRILATYGVNPPKI